MEIGPLNEFKDWSTRAGYNGESPNHPLVPFSGFRKSHLVIPDFVRQESKRGDKILLKKIFDRGLRSMIQMDERPIRHDVMEVEVSTNFVLLYRNFGNKGLWFLQNCYSKYPSIFFPCQRLNFEIIFFKLPIILDFT